MSAEPRSRSALVRSLEWAAVLLVVGGVAGYIFWKPLDPMGDPRAARALALVVVDADVGFDEAVDPGLVEVIELVEPRPGRERDRRVHIGVGRQDQVHVFFLLLGAGFILEEEAFQLFHQRGASLRATILD